MISQFIELCKVLGVTTTKLRIGVIMLLSIISTFYITKFILSQREETSLISKLIVSTERIELKLDNINGRIEGVETQLISLSKGSDKVSETQMAFLKPFVQDNTTMLSLYKDKYELINLYKQEYYPHLNGYSIGVKVTENNTK